MSPKLMLANKKSDIQQSIAIYSAKYPIAIPYICLKKNTFIQNEFLSNDKQGSSINGANAPGTTVAIQTVGDNKKNGTTQVILNKK